MHNPQAEILKHSNRIRPAFYEDFEDDNGMDLHKGASLTEGKVCLKIHTRLSDRLENNFMVVVYENFFIRTFDRQLSHGQPQ